MSKRRKHYSRTLKGYWLHRTLLPYEKGLCFVFTALAVVLVWLTANYQQLNNILYLPTLLAVALAAILGSRLYLRRRRLNQYRTIYWLRHIEGLEFEHYVANLWRRCGHKTTVTKESGDFGVDIVSYKSGRKYVTQCKNPQNEKNKVGSPEMQQFLGSIQIYGADGGIFVTTSDFTKDATAIARKHNIHLVDGLRLAQIIEQKFGRR